MILVGQVYSHKYYFKIVKSIDSDSLTYLFFNRDQYYFPPNNRRKAVDINCVTPIEVTDTIDKFLKEVKIKRMELLIDFHGRMPLLGMATKRQSHK